MRYPRLLCSPLAGFAVGVRVMNPSSTGAVSGNVPPGLLCSLSGEGSDVACNGAAHAALPGDWAQKDYTWDASTLVRISLSQHNMSGVAHTFP